MFLAICLGVGPLAFTVFLVTYACKLEIQTKGARIVMTVAVTFTSGITGITIATSYILLHEWMSPSDIRIMTFLVLMSCLIGYTVGQVSANLANKVLAGKVP